MVTQMAMKDTGGGGGGGGFNGQNTTFGGPGGSGIVIIKYEWLRRIFGKLMRF